MMNQAEDPLAQLRPIHLPEINQSLMLAPGWWVVIGLLIAFVVYLGMRWHKKRQKLKLIKPALTELENIATAKPNPASVAQLSALMKRVCLTLYPAKQIASLAGIEWLNFIQQQTQTKLFNESQEKLFEAYIYQAPNSASPLDEKDWAALIQQSKLAIEQLIKMQAAKEAK
ncbi:DUF4381 domain-containing protein [Aliikangiella sp. IMCC44632]